MERAGGTNNDTTYFWEWIESGVGTNIYKVGVTSWRLGDARIKQVALAGGMDYRLIALCFAGEGATEIKGALLDMGDTVAMPEHVIDGRIEFRIYNDEELAFIYELLGEDAAA